MAIEWVDISTQPSPPEFREIREALAAGIKLVIGADAKGIPVRPEWIYEIDIMSLLGRITGAMKIDKVGDPTNGQVHCWTLGIANASYVTNQYGEPDIIGGFQWTWRIGIDIWGIFKNDGTKEDQIAAENEARLVSAMLFRNAQNIVAGVPSISKIGPLQFSALQPTPFSDGTAPIVASGRLMAEIREAITI